MATNVCIIGGGHIGTTLSCYIKYIHPEFSVRLLTNHPDRFDNNIKCNDIENEISYSVTLDVISSDPSEAVVDAEIIYIALPHFLIEDTFCRIAPYVIRNAYICVLPGGGGCEFVFHKYFTNDATLCGFQRVPFTAKLVTYGRETNLKSWKPYSVVGSLQAEKIDNVCEIIERCGLKTVKASNYLEIALTPTNPILHTSRTYKIFGDYTPDHVFDEKFKFYVGWSDESSQIMLSMDAELHRLLDVIQEKGIDTSAIKPLTEHYGAPDVKAMTKKINSIVTFQSVYAPLKQVENGYVADRESRMFTEDFPWGLMAIRSYFEYFDIDAPVMDEVLKWYESFMGLEWFVDGKLKGKDLVNTGVIHNYGIESAEELISFYGGK